MIKRTLILLVILFLSCVNTEAQIVDTSAVNIRAILEKQIADIKQRENEGKDIIKVESQKQAGVVHAANFKFNEGVKEFLTKDAAAKIFVIVEILMLSGLIFLWSTRAKRNKKRKIAVLKNNIKKLREERIGSLEENGLSMLRGGLRYDPIKINDSGKDITFRARKNNIGKGEVHLAAKIKLLTGEYK